MIASGNRELSTAQLAERTGVPAGTLRVWESRHGFPSPARLPGGHRRYTERDAEQVKQVARLRQQGLSMSAAVEQVRNAARPTPNSVFAGLRELYPEAIPAVLTKSALLTLTHALEDEYCARAAHGLLVGCFQRERFYRQSGRRWAELARTAELAVALADFAALRKPVTGAIEVPIDPTQPLAREWVLIIDAPEAQACLAAWEHPSQVKLADDRRRFEVLWSFEPAMVRSAGDVGRAALSRLAPAIADQAGALLSSSVTGSSPEMRFGAGLTHRIVAYLGARLELERRR